MLILLRIVLLFTSASMVVECVTIACRRDTHCCSPEEIKSMGIGSGLSETATGVILFEVWQECVSEALASSDEEDFGEEMVGFDLSHEEMGDEDGVVTVVDIDDRLLPPKLSHDPDREVVDAEGGLDTAEQAAHEPLLVRCLFRGDVSVDLPFSRLRSPSSHSTTFRRLARSSVCKGVRLGCELYDREGWLIGHE